ncbi:MAG: putative transposase [Planctomycetota bacterium]|jgi:putative transposase
MKNVLTPHLSLITALAGWLNREQQKVFVYLREENRVLKEQLGTKRLRLTDTQRRRLAAKGWEIGRRLLGEYAAIVTPDTLLR